jgi:ADP-ribosylglycohydrolase
MDNKNILKSSIDFGIVGLCVGDALGVPVEFMPRRNLDLNPVTTMVGHGSHNQPLGTWSDDTSMTLALADSLATKPGLDYDDVMKKFAAWLFDGEYTPWGETFDVGRTSMRAIDRYYNKQCAPLSCGGASEHDNGNGSLMRILPIFYFIRGRYGSALNDETVEIVHNVSSLTHAHPRSKIACVIYFNIANRIFREFPIHDAIPQGISEAMTYYEQFPEYQVELTHFRRLRGGALSELTRDDISSSGYVVDTLEAALWCLLKHDNYRDSVLEAVNLGGDTDTIAAVCGGLAGLYYELKEGVGIPQEWIDDLANFELVRSICNKFTTNSEDPLK